MSSTKTSKKKAKKGAKPEHATEEQTQVTTTVDDAAEAAQINEAASIETPAPETTEATTPTEAVAPEEQPAAEPPIEAAANVEQAAEPAQNEPPAETPASDSTTLVWPEQPIIHETDLASYYMWTTACGRYRVYRSVARLNGGAHHFNAEVRNGDGGYHSIEQAKDGCGRPRDYRTLDSAVEVCRLHFASVQAGASSDEAAMFAYAQTHGLDVLPAVSGGEPQTDETKATTKSKRIRKPREEKLSAIDAAAKVLGEAGKSMTCKELIEMMAARGYWTTPGGQTPHATLYAAILREMKVKGKDARFAKAERGKFALAKAQE